MTKDGIKAKARAQRTARPTFRATPIAFNRANDEWAGQYLPIVRIAAVTLAKTPGELEEMIRSDMAGSNGDLLVEAVGNMSAAQAELQRLATLCQEACQRLEDMSIWIER